MDNSKVIWDFLKEKTGNEYGTAAIMGNLMAESSLRPDCATGKKKTANYVQDADEGKVDFVHDSVAFGMVQWCYYSRKQGLLDYAKSTGRSVGHLQMQLEYMVRELSGNYKTAWNAVIHAKSIREASDVVMARYEKPATQTEAAKQKRANYGQKYYDLYASGVKPVVGKKIVRITKKNVNIRVGNGKGYKSLGFAQKDNEYDWVASSENGWHAIACTGQVCWVSGDFSEVVTK